MALPEPSINYFKLKYPLLKLFEITISAHSSGVNTLHCHFMYKNLNFKSFVSRCKCVSCFDTILVVNPEKNFLTTRLKIVGFLFLGRHWLTTSTLNCNVVTINIDNVQYFSIKSYVADRYKNLLTAAILVHIHKIDFIENLLIN